MAMQLTLLRYAPRVCVPWSIIGAARKSHSSTHGLCHTNHRENLMFSNRLVALQEMHLGTTKPSFVERKLPDLHLANHKQFLDLDVFKPTHKWIYVPSTSLNEIKVYEDKHLSFSKTILDPLLKDFEVGDPAVPGQPTRKEAHRMINIRKRKMRIHKRKKLAKKMKFVWEKVRMKREVRKETTFRLELLTQIDEAETFNAEKHVKGILDRIRHHKKPPTAEERWEEYRQLLKKNKSNTLFIKPKFDD